MTTTPFVLPVIIPQAWALNGDKNTIPTLPDSTPGHASLDLGFPPLTRTKIQDGGVPPSGLDFNGIFNLLSQYAVWANGGGLYPFNAALATATGGYKKGAVLINTAGTATYISLVDNNTVDFNTTPSTIGTNWALYSGGNRGGFCGTSTGAANVQVLTPTVPVLKYVIGDTYSFFAGFTNTGSLGVNISGLGLVVVYKDSPSGPIACTGGEVVAGNRIGLQYDGTRMHLVSTALGTAAMANASANTGTVAATSGSFTAGHILVAADAAGTVQDSGQSFVTLSGNSLTIANAGNTIQPGIYNVDTTGGAFSINLSATLIGLYTFIDAANYWGTNNFTINGNTKTIGAGATDTAALAVAASTFLANISNKQFYVEARPAASTPYWRCI